MTTRKRKAPPAYRTIVGYWRELIDEENMACDWDDAHELCWRCGLSKRLQKCHIIPHCLDGEADPSNIVLLCARCHEEAPAVTDSAATWHWIEVNHAKFPGACFAELIYRELKQTYDLDYTDLGRVLIPLDVKDLMMERLKVTSLGHGNRLSLASVAWVLHALYREHAPDLIQ